MRDYKVHWEERCKGRIRIYEGTEDSGLKDKCVTSGWCVKYVPRNFTCVFKLKLPPSPHILCSREAKGPSWQMLLCLSVIIIFLVMTVRYYTIPMMAEKEDLQSLIHLQWLCSLVVLHGERFGLQPSFSVSCIPGFAYQIWNLFGMFAIKIPTRELTSARK